MIGHGLKPTIQAAESFDGRPGHQLDRLADARARISNEVRKRSATKKRHEVAAERGTVAARSYDAEPDIAAWANGCALNPARIEPSQRDDPAVQVAAARLADVADRGLARMAELGHEPRAMADRASEV